MSWLETVKKKYANDRFFKEVFVQEIYKPVYDLGQVETVLDVGALAGEFSFYMYDHATRIYALEPDPLEYAELIENIDEHHLTKITPFHLALSGSDGKGLLLIQGRGANTMVTGPRSENVLTVPTISLYSFLEQEKIASVDVLKIDIESHEDAVFTGENIEKAMKKVHCIIGEHGNTDLLRNFGFEVTETKGPGWIAKRI